MVLAEHELLSTAENLVEEASRDKANGISGQDIRKRLSVRLRTVFPEADTHVISEIVETVMRKAEAIPAAVGDSFIRRIQGRVIDLIRLYEGKRSSPSRAKDIAHGEMKATQGIMDYFRKDFLDDVLSAAERSAKKEEFVISYDEYRQALKTKNVKSNLSYMFGLDGINSVLAELMNKIRQGSIDEEGELIHQLEERVQDLVKYEDVLHNYFSEASKLGYDKRIMGASRGILKGASATFLTALRPLSKLDVKGKENIPSAGAFILAPRHYHNIFDIGIVVYLPKRKIHYAAGSWAIAPYGKFSKTILKGGAIPIKMDKSRPLSNEKNQIKAEEFEKTFSGVESLRDMMRLLNHGEGVCIFPEGDSQVASSKPVLSSPYNPPNKGYVFLAYMAYKTYGRKVPVIPMGLNYDTEHKTLPRWCKVRVGRPFYIPFERFATKDKKTIDEMLDYYTTSIFEQVKFLSENWDGEPSGIPYPGEAEKTAQAVPAKEEQKGVIRQAEKVLEELTHQTPLEVHCIPIIKAVLERKINLVSAGMQAKSLNAVGRISYESYQTMLHVLHALGRYFLERPWQEAGVKTLQSIAAHATDDNGRFVEAVIDLVKSWDEEKEREKRRAREEIRASLEQQRKKQLEEKERARQEIRRDLSRSAGK